MADINAVANSPEIRQHFDKYYQTFDSDRPQLASFYHATSSCLTFEGNVSIGGAAIMEKLISLPFQKVSHAITTLDALPVAGSDCLVILVSGQLKADDDPKIPFSDSFVLRQIDGNMLIASQIFRLGVHNF